MDDLELTKACASAMGYEIRTERSDGIWTEQTGYYDPLHDDAQAMALVKKCKLRIDYGDLGTTEEWFVGCHDGSNISADNRDLNRAIVECVAKLPRLPGKE